MRKKGVFLEYSIEIALIGREGGNILSVKQNLAFVRGLKSADNAQGCCLAAAGRTENGDKFLTAERQTDIAQRVHNAAASGIVLYNMVELEHLFT